MSPPAINGGEGADPAWAALPGPHADETRTRDVCEWAGWWTERRRKGWRHISNTWLSRLCRDGKGTIFMGFCTWIRFLSSPFPLLIKSDGIKWMYLWMREFEAPLWCPLFPRLPVSPWFYTGDLLTAINLRDSGSQGVLAPCRYTFRKCRLRDQQVSG